MRIRLLLFFGLVVFFIIPQSAFALSCVSVQGPLEAMQDGALPRQYDTIFIATPIKFSGEYAQNIKMKVHQVIAGDKKDKGTTITLIDDLANIGNGLAWSENVDDYVIVANKDKGKDGIFKTNICLPNQAATDELKTQLLALSKKAEAKDSVKTHDEKVEKPSFKQAHPTLANTGRIASKYAPITFLVFFTLFVIYKVQHGRH